MDAHGNVGGRNGRWCFVALVLAIAIINLVAPRNYFLLFVDHLSYLPTGFLLAWTAGIALLMTLVPRGKARREVASVIIALTALLLLVSFVLYRTTLPGLQGDGEAGAWPHNFGVASIFRFPGAAGRLQSFLSTGLKALGADGIPFTYHFSNLAYENRDLNRAWILATMLTGAAIVLVVTRLVSGLRTRPSTRIGIQLCFLTSSAMLGAYGHFDSYIVPALTVVLWFVACLGCLRRPGRISGYLWLGCTGLLALWAHPMLGVLCVLSAGMVALRWWGRHRRDVPAWIVPVGALVVGVVPYGLKSGNWELLSPALAAERWWLIHEKLASLLQAALPALVLAAVVLCGRRGRLRRLSVPQAFGALTAASAVVLTFTVWLGYGMKDEFIYALFGLTMLSGIVLLTLFSRVNRAALLWTGLLSLYLFVPRMLVYAGEPMNERYIDHYPRDRCWVNRELSPYWILAQMQPLDTPGYQAKRLQILESAIANGESWGNRGDQQALNAGLDLAWSFAFGRYDREVEQFEHLVELNPDMVRALWMTPNVFATGRYDHRASWVARERCKAILQDKLRLSPKDAVLQGLLTELNRMQDASPAPQPLKDQISPDIYPELYMEGYGYGSNLKRDDLAQQRIRTIPELFAWSHHMARTTDLRTLPRVWGYVWRAAMMDAYRGFEPSVTAE